MEPTMDQHTLEALQQPESEVQSFYRNSVVFLTGGSGFMGKQLLEKLFRSSQISRVYMLLRSKKERNIENRINELVKDPVFDSLRNEQPQFYDKISGIEGDVAEIRLGINDEDWKTLTEQVDVIFHVAATTRFDETLRTATLINVRGTREAILLGKACKKLRSYVHVSTAYSHATTALDGANVLEQFYETPIPPETLISMVEKTDISRLNSITAELIKGWPNTYAFTKAIAEELVRTMSVDLPICIVRPGVVLNTYREPRPGWLDKSCLYGATGLMLGLGSGVLHTHLAKFNAMLGFVPCDYVNNAIIVAGKETAARPANDIKIYTVSSTNRNPLTFCILFREILRNGGVKIMPSNLFYYTYGITTSSKFWFPILSFIFHIIPAHMADFIFVLMGKQGRFARVAKKLQKMSTVMSYFILNEWNFIDYNLKTLHCSLSQQDKSMFNFDVADIDWPEYIAEICVGFRKYILKQDDPREAEIVANSYKCLKIVHYVYTMFSIYFIWRLMHFLCSIIN